MSEIRPSSTLLWISILTGPVAFAVNQLSQYALVTWACLSHREWALYVLALTSFVAAVAAALLGWLAFSRLDRALERARFMAMSGFILGAFFALSILAMAVPHLFMSPCN